VPDAAEQFERLKRLEGEWVALAGEGDAPAGSIVRYQVTSGGTAVVETLFVGTPHEMTTVYFVDAGALSLVQYCMGNQPKMVARECGPDGVLRFEFVGGSNVDPGTTSHMHAAEICFTSEARLDTRWTHWKDGQAAGEVHFALVRSWL
jgi:hypothetical protein